MRDKGTPEGTSAASGAKPATALPVSGTRENRERTTSLHLPVRDRAIVPENVGVGRGSSTSGRWVKQKKLSKRQLANAARARHRGTFLDQLMHELDPSTFTKNPYLEFLKDPLQYINKTLYGEIALF